MLFSLISTPDILLFFYKRGNREYGGLQGYRIICGAILEKMMFSLPCSNSIFTLACCLNRHAVEVNDVNTRDGKLRLHICALGMNFGYKYRKKMQWLILSFVILRQRLFQSTNREI
jgi:hypothetical protein